MREHSHKRLDHAAHDGAPRGGLDMQELAQLAASSSVTGWADLFPPILQAVFQIILDEWETPRELLTAWQPLALTCRAWRSALLGTPVGLELKAAVHLGEPALRWMARAQLEFLMLARTLEVGGADRALLADPAFQAHSGRSLRSLVNFGAACLPLLPTFSTLQQLTLFVPPEEAGPEQEGGLDIAPLRELPKLSCLTIAGHFGSLDAKQLPHGLRHLTLSCYSESGGIDLVGLPSEAGTLEFLSVKADYVLLDWADVCQRCLNVTVCAQTAMLRCGRDAVHHLLAQPPGAAVHADPQLTLYRRFGACVSEGEEIETALLAFHHLALYAGERDLGATLIDADDFLEQLRADLLGSFDVDPAYETYPSFVRDRPADSPCFVLSLEWQGEEAARSLHFTTPISEHERQLLLAHPVWQLAWCRDPRVRQVLTDPTFIERSGPTLTNLTNVPLWRGADLTPFAALKVLMVLAPDRDADEAAEALAPPAAGGGTVMGVGGGGGSDGGEEAEAEGAAQGMQVQETLLHSLRLPEGLESLCLSAENVESEHDFLAEWLPSLPRLQELGLFSYRSYDLRDLPATVTCVRISNPRLGAGEVVGGPGYNFPQWPPASRSSSSSSSSSNGSSESEAAGPGQAEAGRAETVAEQLGRLAVSRSSSGASFESAQSELSLRVALPGEAPSSSVQQAEAGGGDGSRMGAEEGGGAGAADSTPCEAAEPAAQRAGSGASGPGTPATSELVPAPAPAGEGGTSSSGSGGPGPGPRRRGPAHHHHRDLPREGRGSSPEPQEGDHQCTDPNCPLHSGKRFLQLSFTDHREHAAVDLSAMVASRAHMVTVACGAGAAPGPPAEGGGAPTALELRHTGSLAELLQEMEAAGVDTLEVSCAPGSAYFLSAGSSREGGAQPAPHGFSPAALLQGLLSAVGHHASASASRRVPLLTGLRQLAEAGAGRWEAKSFDGENVHDGVVESARSWALLHTASAQQRQAVEERQECSSQQEQAPFQ